MNRDEEGICTWALHFAAQWRHVTSMTSLLVGSPPFVQQIFHADNHENMKSSALLALCERITPHKGPIMRTTPLTKAGDAELWYFSLICAWTNGWENKRDIGDLRRHLAHYDVTAMLTLTTSGA